MNPIFSPQSYTLRKGTTEPVPCSVTAPKVIASTFILEVSDGRASIKFEAKGAMSRSGYAGNIQIGVMLCIGKDLLHSVTA